MRLAIFSDVHGNLPALELMLEHASPVDGYICLGDVVNYGPWSNECLDLIASLPNVVSVQGNHEEYFREGRYGGSHPVARAFFDVCYPEFGRHSDISSLPATHTLGGFAFTHTIHDRYIFPDTAVELDRNVVIGHSHRQFTISQPPFTLHNPGSVGQNRQYINVIDYMTLQVDSMRFDRHSLTYDVDVVIQEMRRTGYPEMCIDYYARKPRLN